MTILIDAATAESAVAGGALIGLGVVVLLLGARRIAGVSGHLGALTRGQWTVSLPFIAGLLLAPWLYSLWRPLPLPNGLDGVSLAAIVLAGVLVGSGTQLGNGCTSGHGVCGLANQSPRSLVSVLVFMAVAAAVVALAGLA